MQNLGIKRQKVQCTQINVDRYITRQSSKQNTWVKNMTRIVEWSKEIKWIWVGQIVRKVEKWWTKECKWLQGKWLNEIIKMFEVRWMRVSQNSNE